MLTSFCWSKNKIEVLKNCKNLAISLHGVRWSFLCRCVQGPWSSESGSWSPFSSLLGQVSTAACLQGLASVSGEVGVCLSLPGAWPHENPGPQAGPV